MNRSIILLVSVCIVLGLVVIRDETIIRSNNRNSPYQTVKQRHKSKIIINTWPFTDATEAAWKTLQNHGSALDAVESAGARCEELQCSRTVGYGGSPDENGETTLDAMIMDGDSLRVGAVGSLRHVRQAIKVARLVMETTTHSLLVGLQATQFANEMGMEIANLTTDESAGMHKDWRRHHCQPNFRLRGKIAPDPSKHCGPYKLKNNTSYHNNDDKIESTPLVTIDNNNNKWPVSSHSHDTIAMIAIDKHGSIASGCSTNGAIHKIPGRVGDSAVAGAGAYADSDVGGCGSTGNGDIHLRFLPCMLVIESMRNGMSPTEAAEHAVKRMAMKEPERYVGAVIAVDKNGRHGGAMYGFEWFKYAWKSDEVEDVHVVDVEALQL